MARHMRNGRDYSRPGPKVDYELRKDSNNAARSGEVYDKIEEIQSHLIDNGKSFIFGYRNGKFGYYTEESKGADSFVPFRSGFDGELLWSNSSPTSSFGSQSITIDHGTSEFNHIIIRFVKYQNTDDVVETIGELVVNKDFGTCFPTGSDWYFRPASLSNITSTSITIYFRRCGWWGGSTGYYDNRLVPYEIIGLKD